MSDRDEILRAVRNHAMTPVPRPELPDFADRYPATPEAFGVSLAIMGGIWDESLINAPSNGGPADYAALSGYIRGLFPAGGVFCSAVRGIDGDLAIGPDTPAGAVDHVEVGIVRAKFGVAETGSIWLSEAECPVNALGYLAQHLVVLLSVKDILPNLHAAYRRAEFSTARYSVLMSGPSATADIEGVLIRGAQGVRSLRVIGLPG